VKFCYEHPLLIEEVVAVEESSGPPAVYESIEAERGEKMSTLQSNTQRLLQSRFDRRMESAEDAVSKKRLESERVRMDVQNQKRFITTDKTSLRLDFES
jgi:hypothetical protein